MPTSGDPSQPQAINSWPARIGYAAMTVSRLALGLGMIPYGVSKLFDIQFQLPASQYAKPLGDASGKILTWAFLGYSPAFQVLLGVCETLPALLLLFNRTRRLGALLLFPVVLNVAMFNYFLDLWAETRQISAVYLLLNVFLLLYDFRLYVGFAKLLPSEPLPIASRKIRIATRAATFVICAAVSIPFLYSLYSNVNELMMPVTDFAGERQINRAGTWKIDSLRIDGQPVATAATATLYFDFSRRCTFDDGVAKHTGKFEANKLSHAFRLIGVGLTPQVDTFAGKYRALGDGLALDGTSSGHQVSLTLRRDRWPPR